MATAQEYAAWIVQNQDKRDTPEFATVAAAYQQAKNKPQTTLAPLTADPTEGMSGTDKFLSGMGKAFTDVGRGVGQVFGQVSQDDVLESRKRDEALMKTGAGQIGNIAGNVAAFAPTAMIPGANTVTGAALYGGLSNALMTPGDFTDRAIAGGLGAAGGAVGQLIPKAIGTVKAAAEPLTAGGREKIIGRTMNKAVGDDAAAIGAKLRASGPLVPGSMPTAAEVAESGGMSALQRAMSAADPESYAHREMEQNAARIAALRGIAGDDAKMAAAEAARSSAAKPLYDAAKAAVVPGDAELETLLKRPVMKQAWAKAQELAANKGEKISLGGKAASTKATVGSDGVPLLQDIAESAPEFSGKGLHYLKLALDDMLETSPMTSLGKNDKAAIVQNKEQLLSWLETRIPEYGQASEAWAKGSKPINQMEIGKALMDKMSPALSDHGALGKETAAKYAQALRNGDQTAKAATGFKQGLEQVMEPGQMDTLKAVGQDLARKSNAQDLGRGVGSNTFQNFAMDNLANSMGMPSAVKTLGGIIPGMSPTMTLLAKGAQGVGGLAYKKADEQIRQDMAQALLNPQASARLMELAADPGMLAKALQALPKNVQKALPPEEVLRLLQASPGVAGVGLANARQE